MDWVRQTARWVSATPFHPQWLMTLVDGGVPSHLSSTGGFVLDVGSGRRWLQRRVAGDAHYIALDYPPTAMNLYGSVPDVFGDACSLPFKDASFDAVACLEVIEHVANPADAMREIARVLKSGGRAFLTMPFLYPIHDAPHDYQRWTYHGWVRSAAAAGLSVEDLRPTGRALHAAGLLTCLALAGPLISARPGARWALLPLLLVMVPVINITAAAAAWLWPSWDAMPIGYRVELRKP